jgi:toxin-antitoxin system PIN domain toxin
MLFPDVNVLVHAFRDADTAEGPVLRTWLERSLGGDESVGISEQVLASVVRIVTHPRIFVEPAPAAAALEFCEAVSAAPAAQVVRPGPRHWAHFRRLVAGQRLRGNDVADAYLASLALEHGATFVTLDRGFRRFDGLRLLDPMAG